MPRLTPCPSCHAHVLVDERQCPHCGGALRTTGAPLAAVVVAGLMLAGCPAGDDGNSDVGEPEYGVPATEGVDTNGETTAADTGGTGGTTGTGETASTGDTDASAGEAEYGVAETGTGTTGASTGDTDASAGEADYGVAETGTGTSAG